VAGAFTEPVFLTYKATPELNHLINTVRSRLPVYDFVTDDGVAIPSG